MIATSPLIFLLSLFCGGAARGVYIAAAIPGLLTTILALLALHLLTVVCGLPNLLLCGSTACGIHTAILVLLTLASALLIVLPVVYGLLFSTRSEMLRVIL